MPASLKLKQFLKSILWSAPAAALCLIASAVSAEVIPDATLPDNSSVLDGCIECIITGGTLNGDNLFHSFEEFSIPEGGEAYFDNVLTVENIISRITGGGISDINGDVRANGNANLFLINLNGFIFGEQASLSIGGSFLATTASSLLFADGVQFGTENATPESTLLTVSVPTGLQFGQAPGDILVRSQPSLPIVLTDSVGGLQVPTGETLALMGGDVRLEGSQILAPGANVQLGGLIAPGVVALDANQKASFPEDIARADVALMDGARLDVTDDGGGSVSIVAENLSLTQESQISGGISAGVTGGNLAGDITISAFDTVELLDGSGILATVSGQGNAGKIEVNTTTFRAQGEDSEGFGSSIRSGVIEGAVGESEGIVINASDIVELLDGAFLTASTEGQGNAGKIEVNTTTFHAQGEDSIGFGSSIQSGIFENAVGRSEGIVVNASDVIELLDGAFLTASPDGQGDAGRIEVNTTTFRAQGEDSEGFGSRIESVVFENAMGGSEGIVVNASEVVELLDGAFLTASTRGQGDAGSIEVNTTTFRAQGENSEGVSSSIESNVSEVAVGSSEGIVINASEVIELLDGAFLTASTEGQGDAGRIEVNTTTFRAQGEDSTGFGSGIGSVVFENAVGRSEGIVVNASDTTELLDGTILSASTGGLGDAGRIEVNTTTFRIQGEDSTGQTSAIGSIVAVGAVGSSGDIVVNASDTVELLDGAVLDASTEGQGDTGSIEVNTTTFRAQGKDTSGGSSRIRSIVAEGALGSSEGIVINASDTIDLLDGAVLNASTEGQGDAGRINIITPRLSFTDAAAISTETTGVGNANAIIVNSAEAVTLGQNTRLTAETSGSGDPGAIEVTTPTLTIGQDAELSTTITETSTNQDGGSDITLNTSVLDISGSLGVFAETNSDAPAGDLSIQPTGDESDLSIQFRDNGFISALTTAAGEGGSITLTAPEDLSLVGQGRVSVETQGAGDGGELTLAAREVSLSEGVVLSATTAESGTAGDIIFNVSDSLAINNSTIESSTGIGSTGQGGDIDILNTAEITLREGGQIAVNSAGQGRGGEVELTGSRLILDDNSRITATTRSSDGGDLTFTLGEVLLLRNGSRLSATAGTAEGAGDGGNINLLLSDGFLIAPPNENSDIVANAFSGTGGNINITAQNIIGLDQRPATPGNTTNDIDASSQLGTSGSVVINNLDLDLAQGLIELPADTESSNQVAERCLIDREGQSAFVTTGQGGTQPTPRDILNNTIVELVDLGNGLSQRNGQTRDIKQSQGSSVVAPTSSITEAQGWKRNHQNEVVLVSQPSHFDSLASLQPQPCDS